MPSANKVILFTGPPSSSLLTEASCVVGAFDQPFRDLLGLAASPTTAHHQPLPLAQHAAWRVLHPTRQPLHTGHTQLFDASSLFFTTAAAAASDPSDASSTQDLLTQFCEHSLAIHATEDQSDLSDTETSFMSTAAVDTSPSLLAPVSNLRDLPSAKHILRLHPQTVTHNIIVGVLSVSQPRSVTTRWGSTLSLVEVLVGDCTATGFAVTFWIPAAAECDVATTLRRQDVVLMENVALHVFRDKVYGQSLRRGLTRVRLLWRADGAGLYSSRALRGRQDGDSHRDRTRDVRDWVLTFVGGNVRGASVWDKPPDDTQ